MLIFSTAHCIIKEYSLYFIQIEAITMTPNYEYSKYMQKYVGILRNIWFLGEFASTMDRYYLVTAIYWLV